MQNALGCYIQYSYTQSSILQTIGARIIGIMPVQRIRTVMGKVTTSEVTGHRLFARQIRPVRGGRRQITRTFANGTWAIVFGVVNTVQTTNTRAHLTGRIRPTSTRWSVHREWVSKMVSSRRACLGIYRWEHVNIVIGRVRWQWQERAGRKQKSLFCWLGAGRSETTRHIAAWRCIVGCYAGRCLRVGATKGIVTMLWLVNVTETRQYVGARAHNRFGQALGQQSSSLAVDDSVSGSRRYRWVGRGKVIRSQIVFMSISRSQLPGKF